MIKVSKGKKMSSEENEAAINKRFEEIRAFSYDAIKVWLDTVNHSLLGEPVPGACASEFIVMNQEDFVHYSVRLTPVPPESKENFGVFYTRPVLNARFGMLVSGLIQTGTQILLEKHEEYKMSPISSCQIVFDKDELCLKLRPKLAREMQSDMGQLLKNLNNEFEKTGNDEFKQSMKKVEEILRSEFTQEKSELIDQKAKQLTKAMDEARLMLYFDVKKTENNVTRAKMPDVRSKK
jgi:hypothetical protein